MAKERSEEELKLINKKKINALLTIVDFCLAIYLVYNLIAMFSQKISPTKKVGEFFKKSVDKIKNVC